jgi:ParB-like chromosome segregation protein Spo0J
MDVDKIPLFRANGYAVSRDLNPKLVPVASCVPLGRETRKHPHKQLRKLGDSLDRFGFVLAILIDMRGRVVAGWGLVLAARQMGLTDVPAVSLTDLSEAELRMLRLALNRITDDSMWDGDALALEFSEILELAPQTEISKSAALRWGRSIFIWTVAASIRKTNGSRLTLRLHR